MGSRAIQEFTPDGTLVRRIGVKPQNYPREWGIPWGMDSDAEGKVFAVTYLKTPYVRIFDRNGKMLLDHEVLKPQELKDYPLIPQAMDVLLDGSGGFWVSEFSYGQLIHYDEKGNELKRVGTPKFLEEGEPFKTPTFLARQPKTGDIWVSESLQGKIFRITQSGEIIGFMDNRDGEMGVLIMPKDIAPGKEGELLVIDGMLGSLQSFDENGNLVAVYYTPELEYLELPNIVAVAYDASTGDIYVSSKIESAIFRLQLIQ
jgi:sugar lactone lactonase YvrE